MNSPPNELVSVQMRGLKSSLIAPAQVQRISVSMLVRRAIERELGLAVAPTISERATGIEASAGLWVKLSIRVTPEEAERLKTGARNAGLSRGALLMGLLANVPSLSGVAGNRLDCLAALTASCAELSTLSRSPRQLEALLRYGQVQAAQEYRQMLDRLGEDVREHLRLAAACWARCGRLGRQRQRGVRRSTP
jgi:hypothetical protein